MAGEKFPEVHAGEPISAARANREGAVLERLANLVPGSNLSGGHGGSSVHIEGEPSVVLAVLKVTAVVAGSVCKGVLRQYSFQTALWSDGTKEWLIDAGATGTELGVGELVLAYYDRKRGAFVPTVAGARFRVFELKTSLAYGGLATAYVRHSVAPASDVSDVADTITVWDYIGDRRGTGRDDNEDGSPGAIGTAMQLPGEVIVWRVIDLECWFPPVESSSASSASSSSGSISSVSSASSASPSSESSGGSSASSVSSGSSASSGSVSSQSVSSQSESSEWSSASSGSSTECLPCDGTCIVHCFGDGSWEVYEGYDLCAEGCSCNPPAGGCPPYPAYIYGRCCGEESSGSSASSVSESSVSASSVSEQSSVSSLGSSPGSLPSFSSASSVFESSASSVSSQSSASSGSSGSSAPGCEDCTCTYQCVFAGAYVWVPISNDCNVCGDCTCVGDPNLYCSECNAGSEGTYCYIPCIDVLA